MKIYIHKDGQKLGPFDEATIKTGLDSGRFGSSDSAWHEGLVEWQTLQSLFSNGVSENPQRATPEMRASFLCIAGPDAGKRIELISGTAISIGRSPGCNCVSVDSEVIERHVTVVFDQTQATIAASNGVKFILNGEESSRGTLSANEQVRIGWSYWQLQLQPIAKLGAGAVFGKFANRISSAAGVDGIEGLSGSDLLSSVLKRRTDDEIEELFITGTKSTTPPLSEVDTRWPKPWAFFKCIIASVILTGGFYWVLHQYPNSGRLIPGFIFAGSFGIPFSTLIFFVEMNAPRNVSLYQVFKLAIFGGLSSILLTFFMHNFAPSVENFTWGGAIITGLIEETAKIVAVVRLIGRRRFNWTLNGLLFGAAVGAGFASFESAGYVLDGLLDGRVVQTLVVRALLSPFGHLVWTGLAAAALWKVKGSKAFQWEMIKDHRFARVFSFVVISHILWDAPQGVPFMGASGYLVKYLLIGVVGWIIVLSFIQDGLKQIRAAQKVTEEEPVEAAPTVVVLHTA